MKTEENNNKSLKYHLIVGIQSFSLQYLGTKYKNKTNHNVWQK